jgi:Zn-dependent M28 family amino/carboxypeptidase
MTAEVNPFDFMFPGPKAVAVVPSQALEALKARRPDTVTVRVQGSLQRLKTSNVVGTVGPQDGRFVMFTAHRDSVDAASGADDNASGVGVLLELARAWRKSGMDRSARFVALAGEEVGFVGAKAYIVRHRNELPRCALVFNIDTVGGGKETWVDAGGGVQRVDPAWMPPVQAELGPRGLWLLSQPFTAASNVPEWLKEAILASEQQTGIPIRMGQFAGSDHMAFARAGVPATHIASSTGKGHTQNDTAENVSAAALERAGRFVAAVAAKVK